MYAGYSRREGGGGKFLPRVVQISIERAGTARIVAGRPLEFFVSVHEEATALTWRQVVEVPVETDRKLIAWTAELHRWSLNLGLTPATARRLVVDFGKTLERTFLGRRGVSLVASLEPTAVVLCADETMLNLPWETMRYASRAFAPDVPFGRIVSTSTVPRARRDPLDEHPTLRILVVANPTDNLPASDTVIKTLQGLAGTTGGTTVEVDVLTSRDATRAGFAAAVKGRDYDIVHFAGHGSFNGADPDRSALELSDGAFDASDVARLKWTAPPYIVFNSACESARAAAGRRLVSKAGNPNGLVAAFLSAGSEAYIGHFWPVQDASAAQFADEFYRGLFDCKNVGTALTRARERADSDFGAAADLAAPGAIFFGDAGTAERRDLHVMAEPPPDDAPRRDLGVAV